MTKRRRSTGRKQTRRKAPPKAPLWRRILVRSLWAGLGVGLFVGLGVVGYLVYLDRQITGTFEGRRWSVPAQVFAQPLDLYPQATMSRPELVLELKRLGYRADSNLTGPGTYKLIGKDLQIYLREFQFMERRREALPVAVEFRGNRIQRIDAPGGDQALLRLDAATIGSFFPSHGEDRVVLTPDEVPELLAEGLKAIEDRNFDKHLGFSVTGILRAALVNLRAGAAEQGGSTLTQQLVKSYFLTNRRTLERKLQEVAMAVILELRFAKEDLLTAYINEIFLGQNGNRAIHGFGLGAQFYFNKRLQELDPHEIATLIAIIRGPSYYNPFRHPERAVARRDRMLATFARDGLITTAEFERAVEQPLGVVATPGSGGAYYPAFMDKVRAELLEEYDLETLSSEGLSVFTTVRPRLQESVQAAVTETLAQIEGDRRLPGGSLQSAAIVADTQTGEIQALVGGRRGRVDGFNRALSAQRPVGSLLKPVVYLAALEGGMHLAHPVRDEPITLTPEFGEPWSPKNFDEKTRGELPMFRALAESLNLATVHVGTEIGLPDIQNRFASLTGREPVNRYPSLLLGAEAMTPLEMLELYGNFASGGFRMPPKAVIAVLDESGHAITHRPFELFVSIDPVNVAALNRALEIAMAKGTGRSSPFARSGVAGKTGTSNDNRDSWFAGFDNRHVSVVWVGRDDNEVTGLTGSSGALRVWNALARPLTIDPLVHPPVEQLVAVDYETGLRANEACADVVRVPLPRRGAVRIKPGCNIRESVADRFRRWFQ